MRILVKVKDTKLKRRNTRRKSSNEGKIDKG